MSGDHNMHQSDGPKLAEALDNCGLIVDDELRDQAADELRRLHELHVLYQDKVERLNKLCYKYLGELSALRAAKQMQARIDELKGQREWQGLTEEEVMNFYLFWVVDLQDIIGFYKAIDRKLKERNHA